MKKESGFIFLEIVIATALIGVVFTTLLSLGALVINLSSNLNNVTRANAFLKEELEAIRSFRNGNTWANVTGVNFGWGNYYYFSLSGGAWIRNSGSESIGIFTRRVFFDRVYRDAGGIIASSGTLDDQVIKATVTVSWSGKTLQAVHYLTNWQNK